MQLEETRYFFVCHCQNTHRKAFNLVLQIKEYEESDDGLLKLFSPLSVKET